MKVKYLPYPPLQRVHFHCLDCLVTASVYSHYPEVCTAKVFHRCRRTQKVKALVRR